MLILGIDTATSQAGCAIGGHEGVIASAQCAKGRRHAENLAPAIEFICSQADGVILVVGRGQQRSFVTRASEQLAALRARVVGLVFNRAVATDFNQSSASASFRSVRSACRAACPVNQLSTAPIGCSHTSPAAAATRYWRWS